jgi:hypothetical protein
MSRQPSEELPEKSGFLLRPGLSLPFACAEYRSLVRNAIQKSLRTCLRPKALEPVHDMLSPISSPFELNARQAFGVAV